MSGVTVEQANGERHVFATASFAVGDRILTLEGELVDRPSRHSLQVDDGLHLVADEEHAWQFLNHSCDPSAAVRGREVIALRELAPGDEVTFDYNTTEYEMDAPFMCRCTDCDGRTIGGFLRLAPSERRRLRPLLADHLLRRL